MRKSISLILVLVFLVSCLSFAGCQDSTDANEGSVTITIWHDKEEKVAAVIGDALKVLEPEIHVVLEKKDGLTDTLKLVGNDPQAAPDMYFFAHDKIGVYAEMGMLAPITDFVAQDKLDKYMDVTLSAAQYKGTLYQLPIYYETLLFMYNKALMSESEVPATTEQLYNYMKNNTKDGSYGFVEQHSTAYYSIPWVHGFGGELVSLEGEPLLESEEVKNSLAYHHKFLEFMPNDSEYSTVNTLFLEGKAASIIGGPWLVPTARESGIDLGFSVLPTVDETRKALAPYIGVQGVQVMKVAAEAKKDAIAKVLDVLTSPEVGKSMAAVAGCAPANLDCYEDEAVKNDEMVNTMKSIADNAVATPNIPEMDVMFVVAGNLLVAVNMKGTDIDEACADNQSKAEMLVEAMK